MAGRALEYAAKHCWHSRKGAYLRLVDSMADDAPA
jgi:hypothetical protein